MVDMVYKDEKYLNIFDIIIFEVIIFKRGKNEKQYN